MLTASNATGQLIFLPVLAWIVEHYGWRYAAGTAAAVALVVVLPLGAALHARPPGRPRLAPYGTTEVQPAPAASRQPVQRAAAHARRRLALDVLLAARRQLLHLRRVDERPDRHASDPGGGRPRLRRGRRGVAARDDRRLRHVGTTCSGWLTDRYDPRLLLAWYYGLRGLSLLALPYAFGSPHFGLILFVIFYGLDWVATVPPTVALTAEIFGARARRRRLRLDLRRAHVRRRRRRVGRGRGAHVVRRLRLGVRHVRAALPLRGRARDADQPRRPEPAPALGAAPRGRGASPRGRCRAARAASPPR